MRADSNHVHARVRPDVNLPARDFTVIEDQYGVTVRDEVTGVSVSLDWNGKELKAVVSDSTSDDPFTVFTFSEKGAVKASL
jgi:hypothetical protein